MIKGLIFDLDNTLYNEEEYFFAVFDSFSKENPQITVEQLKKSFSVKMRQESNDILGDLLKKNNCYSKSLHDKFFHIYNSCNVSLVIPKDTKDMISFAKQESLKLAIVTNGVLSVQKNKIKSLKLDTFFDSIIYARQFGAIFEKPHKQSFLKSIASLGLLKQDLLFIGDTPFTDIEGANKVGLKTILLNNKNNTVTPSADYIIDNISDLKPLIKKLNSL